MDDEQDGTVDAEEFAEWLESNQEQYKSKKVQQHAAVDSFKKKRPQRKRQDSSGQAVEVQRRADEAERAAIKGKNQQLASMRDAQVLASPAACALLNGCLCL